MPKLGALAIAKAHPLVFGAVLAVAIGIVVYQLVKPKKQKKLTYSNSSGARGGNDDDAPSTGPSNGPFYYDPETKSITDSAPSPKTTNSDVRKRHVTRKSPDGSVGKDNNTSSNGPSVPHQEKKVSKEVQTESIDNNQNVDDGKVLLDKDINSAMSLNEKVNVYLFRNISETDSTDSNDESDSTMDDFKPVKKCCCDCESQSTENSNASSSSDSISSGWSDVSFTEVNKLNKIKTSRAPSICSVKSIESESSIGTVLSGDSELCRGCEQNPVNTHAEPCNHRYMCADCAMRIFRLFKKCKVCRAKIERIVIEE